VVDPEGIQTANRAAAPTFDRGSSFRLPTALLFVGIGYFPAPGPFQLIVPDRPNTQLGLFPTS
jgi:hypothetical protein